MFGIDQNIKLRLVCQTNSEQTEEMNNYKNLCHTTENAEVLDPCSM
jgi:hypothetical protein